MLLIGSSAGQYLLVHGPAWALPLAVLQRECLVSAGIWCCIMFLIHAIQAARDQAPGTDAGWSMRLIDASQQVEVGRAELAPKRQADDTLDQRSRSARTLRNFSILVPKRPEGRLRISNQHSDLRRDGRI
jgi:hypothetical protein